MVEVRKMNWAGSQNIVSNGVRFLDQLEVVPVVGRKKSYKLNRTKYTINLRKISNIVSSGDLLELPNFTSDDASFEIMLCKGRYYSSTEETSRYIVRSTNGIPFRINGVFCYEGFVERGDHLLFGHNQISFPWKSSKKDDSLVTDKVCESKLGILIEGETGTGKTRLAKIIHEKSGRPGNFVHVNLASYSESLIESELFGHQKGAFTGALTERRGAFLSADHGTLFLDEIDSLPIPIQTKLLLFLDSKQIRPVGSTIEKKVSVRLIYASGTNLSELVEKGDMRRDFYYRISSSSRYELLPLREDKDLIVKVINDFCNENKCGISEKLVKYYKDLHWPGNIRQLLGHLEKKLIHTSGAKIYYDDLDKSLFFDCRKNQIQDSKILPLDQVKTNYIIDTFKKLDEGHNVTAKALGISRTTLLTVLKKESYKSSIKSTTCND